jgi:hypothetical protein
MADSTNPDSTQDVGGNQVDTLSAKLLAAIDASGNEFAMGYDDSGCFWRFYYGNRGAGSMMAGWPQFNSESPEVEEALDEYLSHLGVIDLAKSDLKAITDVSNPPQTGDTT